MLQKINILKGTGSLAAGLIILCATLSTGCYYDAEDVLYPGSGVCDTTDVTYSAVIAPLLDDNCFNCHSTAIAFGGVTTDNYAGVKAIADDGRLYNTISHAPGFSPMPKDANQLDDCSLLKIKIWIDAGAPEN